MTVKLKPLTPVAINAMKPNCKQLKDCGENSGLYVRCTKDGVKTFFYRYRAIHKNSVRQVTIGVYVPSITDEDLDRRLGEKQLGLASARQQLAILKADRKAGICPKTRLDNEIKEAKEKTAAIHLTVKALIEVYLTQRVEDRYKLQNGESILVKGSRVIKGQKETRRTLEAIVGKGEVVTEFGTRIASEITHVDIKNLITSIISKGTTVQAGRVLSEINLAFMFCIGRPNEVAGIKPNEWQPYLPDLHTNPCLQAKAYFQSQRIKFSPNKRKRVLDDSELKQFLEWLPDSKFSELSKHALMITLLTGCRSGEAVNIKKADIDLTKGIWRLADDDTKTGVGRNVQLSVQVIEYLRPLMVSPISHSSLYLLPSGRSGFPQHQEQLSQQAYKQRQRKTMLSIPRWTAHDLRRTCCTGLAKLGCPSEIGEAILGHAKQGMEGVYNLHQYEAEC